MPRILVVDDDSMVLIVAACLLERLGYSNLLTAENGQVALEIISRESIDLLITDFAMPGIDGRELISEARKIRPGLPAILLTGSTYRQPEMDYVFLAKPCPMDDLKLGIEQALNIENSSEMPTG